MPSPTALVQHAYDRLAGVYDLVFGVILQPGRKRAVRSIPPTPGLRVLELGIGTGLTIPLYPREWRVTGVDLSLQMLRKACRRVADRKGQASVHLALADGARLPFADQSFDIVLVPYVISAVPDPGSVARELRRVCSDSGRIIFVNHFLSDDPARARVEQWLSPFARRIGFCTNLSLPWVLRAAGLHATEIVDVNLPPLWQLVCCVKDREAIV